MADIELLIKIDEDYYAIIKHGVEHGSDYKPWTLIAHGTPLPKGHGRLIDADAILKDCYWETEKDLEHATVLVEADKESEET